MPTKTWEPPPQQSDTGIRPTSGGMAEPRNFEPGRRERARNADVPADSEHARFDDEEINTHGSER